MATQPGGISQNQHDVKIEIEGIVGESLRTSMSKETHEGEIDVIGWRWGASALLGHNDKRVSLQVKNFTFTKAIDVATPEIYTFMQKNKLIPKITVTFYKAGGAQEVKFYKLLFKECSLGSIEAGAMDEKGHFIEEVTFNFAEVTMEATQQDQKGRKDRTTSFFFRVAENRA